jgi:hypothetical protein
VAAVVAEIGTEVVARRAGCVAEDVVPAAVVVGGGVGGRAAAGHRFCSAVCFYGWYQQRRTEVARQVGSVTGTRHRAVDPQVAAALAVVRRGDPDGAGLAAVGLDWLVGCGGVPRLTQLAVCGFLWYHLPTVEGHGSERARVAAVLGRLLQAQGLSRYAALCTSPATAAILREYDDRGVAAGRRAYHRALDRCGIVPPDVPELRWGTVMGTDEVNAYEATAAMLELAVAAGRLRPGTVGWRTRQVEITRAYLTTPEPVLGGACRLDRIRAERLGLWARCRGEQRRRSLTGLVDRLASAAVVPSDADEYLAPVRWLLERAGTADGIALTGTYHLDHTVVVEAQECFGLDRAGPGPAGTDAEGTCLRALRELLRSTGAVRRTGRRLVLTPLGRRLSADPDELWAASVACLIGSGDSLAAAAREAALVLLADGRQLGREELIRRVVAVLTGEGWPVPGPGAVPFGTVVRTTLAELWRTLRALGMISDDQWLRPLRLSPIGQAAALGALRARAIRPRHAIGYG